MNRDDHLSNEVSVNARLNDSGLSARARSRAVAAFDRLLGSVFDIPTSKFESYVNRERGRSRLEKAAFDAAAERLAGAVGNDADAARLIDGIVAHQMHLLANKRNVAQRAVEYLVSPGPEGNSAPEPDAADVDPDWLNYFSGYAEKADSENVQDLWARVLAGEIRRPVSFSLTTLRLLAEEENKARRFGQRKRDLSPWDSKAADCGAVPRRYHRHSRAGRDRGAQSSRLPFGRFGMGACRLHITAFSVYAAVLRARQRQTVPGAV